MKLFRSSQKGFNCKTWVEISTGFNCKTWAKLDREISVIFSHFSPHRADGSTIGVKIGQKSHLSEKFQGFACASWTDLNSSNEIILKLPKGV
jgi:hypothetical protein